VLEINKISLFKKKVRDDFARDYRLTPADRNADESEFFFKPALIHASW
jgi:hypothetical protein